jgi:hypothetical protein
MHSAGETAHVERCHISDVRMRRFAYSSLI